LKAFKPQLEFRGVRTCDFEDLLVVEDKGEYGKVVVGIVPGIFYSFHDNNVDNKLKGKSRAAKIVILPTKVAQRFVKKDAAKQLPAIALQKQRRATHHKLSNMSIERAKNMRAGIP